jgi:hypothetical protein
MRFIVRIPGWSPENYDLSQMPGVHSVLKSRLENPESMVNMELWHNGYVLKVTSDTTANNARTLECQVIDDTGPTLSEWTLFNKS